MGCRTMRIRDYFFFSSRRRHTSWPRDWSSDVCSSDLPFPIDAVPRLIAAEEWATVSAGIAQRVRTLEHLLDDLYTDQRVIVDGVVPRQLISSSSYLVEEMRGYRPPNGVRVHISGIDLVRDGAGGFRR